MEVSSIISLSCNSCCKNIDLAKTYIAICMHEGRTAAILPRMSGSLHISPGYLECN